MGKYPKYRGGFTFINRKVNDMKLGDKPTYHDISNLYPYLMKDIEQSIDVEIQMEFERSIELRKDVCK